MSLSYAFRAVLGHKCITCLITGNGGTSSAIKILDEEMNESEGTCESMFAEKNALFLLKLYIYLG